MKNRTNVRRLSAAVTAGALSAVVLAGLAVAPAQAATAPAPKPAVSKPAPVKATPATPAKPAVPAPKAVTQPAKIAPKPVVKAPVVPPKATPATPAVPAKKAPVVAPAATLVASTTLSPLEQTKFDIRNEANRQGLDYTLALAVANVESGFNPYLVQYNAVGLFQLTPESAHYASNLLYRPIVATNRYDNIAGGVAILRDLTYRAFNGNQTMAIAAFVQGEQSVKQYGIFPSTREYVNAVQASQPSFR